MRGAGARSSSATQDASAGLSGDRHGTHDRPSLRLDAPPPHAAHGGRQRRPRGHRLRAGLRAALRPRPCRIASSACCSRRCRCCSPASWSASVAFGLFSGWWRHVSLRDVEDIVRGNLLGSVLFLTAIVFLHGLEGFPRAVLPARPAALHGARWPASASACGWSASATSAARRPPHRDARPDRRRRQRRHPAARGDREPQRACGSAVVGLRRRRPGQARHARLRHPGAGQRRRAAGAGRGRTRSARC